MFSYLDYLCFQKFHKTNYEELVSLPHSNNITRKNSCVCYNTFTTMESDQQDITAEEQYDPLLLSTHQNNHHHVNELFPDSFTATTPSFLGIYCQLPIIFLWLCLIHTLYIVIFHVWLNFLPHYAKIEWHMSIHQIGWLAAIPHIVVSSFYLFQLFYLITIFSDHALSSFRGICSRSHWKYYVPLLPCCGKKYI